MAEIKLGSFELVAPIGAGGMGEVWHGRHSETGTDVAVKVMQPEVMDDPTYREAFEMEVRSVASLEHPHIVTILDYGQVPGTTGSGSEKVRPGSPYLVMEYARGGAVSDYFKEIAWPDLRELLLVILDALAHAHAREVIHRDLKPENILVGCGPDWDVKLTDFGLAHASDRFDDSGKIETAWGTPQYMAPEQLRGLWREYGPWTDLYGLGCMAFELICGIWPFDGETVWDIGQAHIKQPIPRLQPRFDVPEGTEAWLRKLLAKDRSSRFCHAADAAFALGQLPALDEAHRFGVLFKSPTLRGVGPAATSQVAKPHETYQEVSTQLLPHLADTLKEKPSPSRREQRELAGDSAPEAAIQRPPLPADWRPRYQSRLSNELMGVSLGLFGLRSIPMVNREEERDEIWDLLQEVHESGQSRHLLVEGAAGTGKSELVRWMARRAREVGGARVFSAFHSPVLGPADGLMPMVERFLKSAHIDPEIRQRHLEKTLIGEGLAEEFDLRALISLFDEWDPGSSGRVGHFMAVGREERYAILYRFFALLAQRRPVWIWLDDVQWGRDALGFARYIETQQATDPAPIFVVMTARTEALRSREVEARMVEEVMQSPQATRRVLGGLAERDTRRLVRHLLRLDEGLAEHILRRSGGVPLFAVQLVEDWVARGKLQMGREGFTLVPGADIAIPDDLHQLWDRRVQGFLETKAPETLHYLEIAAALGQEVDRQEWVASQQRAGLPAVGGLVQRLVEENLARRMGDDWQFAHGLMQESLERGAREAGRWAQWNRVCAQTLTELRELEEMGLCERLAWHWTEAGEPERAFNPLSFAIDQCIERSDFEHAEDLIKWRDELAVGDDGMWRIRGLVDRAQLEARRGAYQRCKEIGEAAAREAERQGMEFIAAQAKLWAGVAYRALGGLEGAEELLTEAGKFFSRHDAKGWLAQSVLEIGRVAEQRGDFELARRHFQHSHTLFAEVDDVFGAAQCFNAIGDVLRQSGEYAEARQASLEALERYETLGNLAGVADCLNDLAALSLRQGKIEEAKRFALEAIRLYRSVGSDDAYFVRLNLAMILLEEAEFVDAEARFEQLVAIFDKKALTALAAQARAGLLAARGGRGRWDGAVDLLSQVATSFELTGVRAPMATRALAEAARQAARAGDSTLASKIQALAHDQTAGMRQTISSDADSK